MITDSQTNFVYFSELLKSKPEFKAFCTNLTSILDRHKISYGFLPETNDIWCRDYMPVQVSDNKFIEYRYDPDYLQEIKFRKKKTYPDIICNRIGLKTIKSNIILDGGNIIKSANKVILTDKIIPENASKYRKAELLDQLKFLFEVDTIILVPWNAKDIFGHADGMIRFIDDNHVLVDSYFNQHISGLGDKLYKILKKNKLTPVEFIFNVPMQSKNNWGYLNYLQMKDLILFPQFGIAEDDLALAQIKEAFPEYAAKAQIEPINSSSIIKEGGVLNCISWNIKKILETQIETLQKVQS
jgi:agmatine/peptidylarginine deiminase